MGCASSEAAFEPQRYDNKTVVWFLGGGPGAPKQQYSLIYLELHNILQSNINSNIFHFLSLFALKKK